ncbi:glycosyltransferase [Streptomyces sp. L500]
MSVVIVVRDQVRDLHRLLHQLSRQDYLGPLDVVIVDANTRPTLARAHYMAYPMPVTLIHETQPSLACAHNRGIDAAAGEWILVAAPEVVPGPTWVSTMVRALANSGAALAGGQVLPDYPTATGPRLSKGVLSLFMPTRWPSEPTEVFGPWLLASCNLGMPRSAVLRFDTDFNAGGRFVLCEDLLTMLRTQAAGEFALLDPRAMVRRVINDRDLTLLAVARRAWWQGLALARAAHSVPSANLPQYPLRGAAPLRDGFSRTWLLSVVAGTARAVGHRTGAWKLRRNGSRQGVPCRV